MFETGLKGRQGANVSGPGQPLVLWECWVKGKENQGFCSTPGDGGQVILQSAFAILKPPAFMQPSSLIHLSLAAFRTPEAVLEFYQQPLFLGYVALTFNYVLDKVLKSFIRSSHPPWNLLELVKAGVSCPEVKWHVWE